MAIQHPLGMPFRRCATADDHAETCVPSKRFDWVRAGKASLNCKKDLRLGWIKIIKYAESAVAKRYLRAVDEEKKCSIDTHLHHVSQDVFPHAEL